MRLTQMFDYLNREDTPNYSHFQVNREASKAREYHNKVLRNEETLEEKRQRLRNMGHNV